MSAVPQVEDLPMSVCVIGVRSPFLPFTRQRLDTVQVDKTYK